MLIYVYLVVVGQVQHNLVDPDKGTPQQVLDQVLQDMVDHMLLDSQRDIE